MEKRKQQKIIYSDIMNLGFTEQIEDDRVYFNRYGYEYSIIELNLTKKISLGWAKETQLCTLYRQDKEGNIKAQKPMYNLKQVKEVIDFFTD